MSKEKNKINMLLHLLYTMDYIRGSSLTKHYTKELYRIKNSIFLTSKLEFCANKFCSILVLAMLFALEMKMLCILLLIVQLVIQVESKKPTNILLILADDLGYGDTSVHPFTGSDVLTPNLELMATRGAVLSNFHTAAAICTPTRASILTGLYPWRLGTQLIYST